MSPFTQDLSRPDPGGPLREILRLYADPAGRRSFADDVAAHLSQGVLLSTPEFFVMARPVSRAAEPAAINDPAIAFPPDLCDTWYIYAFAGEILSAVRHFPYSLPYIAFERVNQNGLRFLPLASFQARCEGLLPRRALRNFGGLSTPGCL